MYNRNIFLSVVKFLDTLAKPFFRCNKIGLVLFRLFFYDYTGKCGEQLIKYYLGNINDINVSLT